MLTLPAILRLSPLALCLSTPPPTTQVELRERPSTTGPAAAPGRMVLLPPDLPRKDLLPAGVPQGTFHLNGLVRKDKTVLLRWANTHGEMPTEGVRLYRQKAGDSRWKELTDHGPMGFYQGTLATKRLKALPEATRNGMLSLFHSTLQYDPATRQRITRAPDPGLKRPSDLTADRVLTQYRTLRAQGRLAKSDLQMLHAQADLDPGAAEIFGLSYVDKPGSGQWRYKIVVKLPTGATTEALCDKLFNPAEPTPVPPAQNLAAKSANGAVLLNWEGAPSDVVAGFNVYRAETSAGPFRRLNGTPVKLVSIEVEDPEAAMRKAVTQQRSLEKELKRRVGVPMTPDTVRDIRTQAAEAATREDLATLSPALSKSLREGVAAGRLPAAGRITPTSAYADDRTLAGNGDLQVDKAYVYKITTVDIGGGESPLEGAPVVSGMARDLQAPVIPGRPHLQAHAAALGRLQEAQAARATDPRLVSLDQAIAARTPQAERSLAPFLRPDGTPLPGATPAPPALPAEHAGLSLSEAKRQRASRGLATLPTRALADVAAASTVSSKGDGTVAPVKLVWTPSPDGDLKTYEVYRAEGTGPFLKLGSTALPEWTDATLEVSHAYRYAVSAADQHGNESARSAEGTVEVCDSRLKDRLAVKTPKGKLASALPTGVPGRRMVRPASLVMRAAGLDTLKATASVVKLPTALGAAPAFEARGRMAPTRRHAGRTLAPRITVESSPMEARPAGRPEAPAGSGLPKAATRFRRTVHRSANVMLQERPQAKELHVVLDWERPLEGYPVEYVVYQAPQKATLKTSAREVRKPVLFTPTTALHVGKVLPVVGPAKPAAASAKPVAAPELTRPGLARVATAAPEQHLRATQRVAAQHGSGLVEAPERKDQVSHLLMEVGPGEFSRVNDTPVAGEHYTLTFPVDVAQFGGATFYFRVQARTREFGRLVEGPLSEVVEVRLPDVVPPAAPANGALDLQEVDAEHFNVALTWTGVAATDLEGYVVDRQALAYTLVEGEPQPGAPLGEPKRLTEKPLGAAAYTDGSTPGGYQRYTLRSVDKTGNASEAQGFLDVLVPGEPVPGAPTELAVAGDTLTWKAAPGASGYTVWRSFTGLEEEYACISGILGEEVRSFALPPKGTMHLKVVARSTTGMNQTASQALLRAQ